MILFYRRIVLCCAALFCLLSVGLAGAQDEPDTGFLGETFIIYAAAPLTDLDGSYFATLYTLDADGSRPLINTDGNQFSNNCGDYSAANQRVLFESTRANNGSSGYVHAELYSVDFNDTRRLRRLTFTDMDETAPRWSPDGTRLVYMAGTDTNDTGTYEIYIMDADGDKVRQLTDNDSADRYPTWSPDGQRIIFHSNRDGDYELYTMLADGSDVQALTDNRREDARAAYAPDGARIAFNAGALEDLDDLFVIDADGRNAQQLTDTPDLLEFGAVWSPDGAQIAYTVWEGFDDLTAEIWVMNADGSDARRLFGDDNTDYGICDWAALEGG
ncbi:MAG: PD40 domain-containing protein [Chloroflexi bacterium]|nr:PD40 domain-containing protein [Chloroflexota bacterium]